MPFPYPANNRFCDRGGHGIAVSLLTNNRFCDRGGHGIAVFRFNEA
ncbi:MAG: hypothetical protein HC789_07470 [Microcoleus sp. CSU_2_2]|nr:hypothetical protein [Microcoleus sp. CSU_2_2]